jgi:hypothetical protein
MSEDKVEYGNEDLKNRFLYHPPKGPRQVEAHAEISSLTLALAEQLCALCPPGRNRSLALTHLEDVRMRANAAIACDGFQEE